jgi:two-component system sensor histidine kinase ChiS
MEYQSNEGHRGSILVVDDNPNNLRLLTTMLKEQGYKARHAINGPAALEAVASRPPEMILLDINMPGMDGYEVCQRLKADHATHDIPIIFISALDEVLDKVRAFSVGGVDYITKPFHMEEVLVRVETHLTLRRLQLDLERRVAERTAELSLLNASYECFVPHEFLSLLRKHDITEVRLGDQVQREMSIMFADIRSFTSLSEHMTPQESFNFINTYLSRVSPAIRQHHGFIDKYIGDAIMALFPYQADDAIAAAIAMLREVNTLNLERQQNDEPPITIGIGLHTGSLMLGVIGEEQRKQGTVIADAVNVASRLEGLTKLYGASLIISEQLLRQLSYPDQYTYRFVDRVQVQGKQEPVSVFEILEGESDDVAALKSLTRGDFEDGLHLYHQRDFAEASVKFNCVLKRNPNDKAARLFLERAAHFMVHGPPPDWIGLEILSLK